MKKINSAFISVFNKENLKPLVSILKKLNIKLYSSGGTKIALEKLNCKVISVEEMTKYPSILGGRVKTLHPKIFGGILNKRNNKSDLKDIQKYNLPSFDLVIVDRMMPTGDGIDLIKIIKEIKNTPVILLTAMGESESRIQGLKYGADDYLSKPFEPEELYLRIQKLLNLYKDDSIKSKKIVFGKFIFNLSSLQLKKESKNIYLTEGENSLLLKLIYKRNEIVLREELAESDFDESELRKVDVQVTRLRQKIETNPKQPHFLKTIRGKGYKLICNEL